MQYQVNRPEIVSDLIDGEVILLNLKAGTYYNLEHTASTLWQWLEAGADRASLLAELTRAYPQQSRLEADLDEWISELLSHQLIVPAVRPPGAGPAFAPTYLRPRVCAHADMQELLLLDPVHEVGEAGWPTLPAR